MVRSLYLVGSREFIRLVQIDGKASLEGMQRELGLLNQFMTAEVPLADYER